jgi:hypothetical protein
MAVQSPEKLDNPPASGNTKMVSRPKPNHIQEKLVYLTGFQEMEHSVDGNQQAVPQDFKHQQNENADTIPLKERALRQV